MVLLDHEVQVLLDNDMIELLQLELLLEVEVEVELDEHDL